MSYACPCPLITHDSRRITSYNPRLMSASPSSRPIRVLLGKVGLDGHDRGLLAIAKALEQAGMEVIYGGIRRTAVQVAAIAVQEDVEAVGLSSMSGSHLPHFPRVAKELKRIGKKDLLLFCGGIIPPEVVARLKRAGFRRVYGPGARLSEIVRFLRRELRPANPVPLRRLDHVALAVRDSGKALKLFRDALGMRLEGSESVPSQQVRTTFLSLGDVHLELVEPASPDSPVSRFLEARGGGVHHVAFETRALGDALENARAAGLSPIGAGPSAGARGKRVAFLHPAGTHKLLIELTEKRK